MGKLDIGKESYFKPHLINENSKISNTLFNVGNDLDMSRIFPLYAPIICNKDDIEQMLIDQIAEQEDSFVFFNTEKINQIVYNGPVNNGIAANEFFKNHSTFLQLCNLPYINKDVRSMKFDAIHEMLSAFSEIYYNQLQCLTLDKVLYMIMDLSTLAIDIKKTYKGSPKIDIESLFSPDMGEELLHFINFFFDIIDKSYPTAIEDTFGKSFTEKLEKLRKNYSLLTEYKQLTQVLFSIKADVKIDGIFPIFTFDFAYLSLFPIVELLACCYLESEAKLNTTNYTFSGKENKRNLYLLTICRLFAYIPIFIKKESASFFFDFELTLASFVNIGWFTRIFHLCHSDVSWLDEIIFKMFGERLRLLISHEYSNDRIRSEEQKMTSMFSLFTIDIDSLQERLESISAFYFLKTS